MIESKNFQRLDKEKVEKNLHTLSERISERFPGSSLSEVAEKLLTIVVETKERTVWISRPII